MIYCYVFSVWQIVKHLALNCCCHREWIFLFKRQRPLIIQMSCIAMLGCLLFLQDIQSDIFLGCKSGILSEKCLAWQVHFFLRKALQKLRGVCYSYELWRRELTLYSYLESCLLKIGNLLILISNILFYMWEESASQTSKFLQIAGDNSK